MTTETWLTCSGADISPHCAIPLGVMTLVFGVSKLLDICVLNKFDTSEKLFAKLAARDELISFGCRPKPRSNEKDQVGIRV